MERQRRKVIAYLEHLINELKAADEDAMVPWTVGEKERVYGLELRSVNDLKDMAGELHIQGRSKMKRDELLAAIKDKLYGSQVKKADVTSINQLIRDERLKVMKKAA
jgi:hypothetical protein